MAKINRTTTANSGSEDKFIELFCDTFGAEKGQYVYLQYPIVDIYGNHRSIDFAVQMPDGRVAIEVDGNTWHQPGIIGEQKYHDDLLKQNSMVYEGWKVYRWTSAQLTGIPNWYRTNWSLSWDRILCFSILRMHCRRSRAVRSP